MINLRLPADDDAAEIVEALLIAADTRERSTPVADALFDAAKRLRYIDPTAFHDAAECVEALGMAEERTAYRSPAQAARWRHLAHAIGDALDTLPHPTTKD